MGSYRPHQNITENECVAVHRSLGFDIVNTSLCALMIKHFLSAKYQSILFTYHTYFSWSLSASVRMV